MQRAENTVSCASPGPGPASRAWPVQLLCSLVLALAGTVAGRPTPVPAATDGSTIVIGLWQTVASAVGLPPGMELPLAGYGGPGDDPAKVAMIRPPSPRRTSPAHRIRRNFPPTPSTAAARRAVATTMTAPSITHSTLKSPRRTVCLFMHRRSTRIASIV